MSQRRIKEKVLGLTGPRLFSKHPFCLALVYIYKKSSKLY